MKHNKTAKKTTKKKTHQGTKKAYLAHPAVVPVSVHKHEPLQESELRDGEIRIVDRLPSLLAADAHTDLSPSEPSDTNKIQRRVSLRLKGEQKHTVSVRLKRARRQSDHMVSVTKKGKTHAYARIYAHTRACTFRLYIFWEIRSSAYTRIHTRRNSQKHAAICQEKTCTCTP